MTDRNVDELLNAWMDLGPTTAPDRVAEAARLEARSTRQTAALGGWLPWRFPHMNQAMRIALATAAVVAVALIGISYLGGRNVGNQGLDDPSPTPLLSPTAAPRALIEGSLDPGTYVTSPFGSNDRISLTFAVPEGWSGGLRAVGVTSTAGGTEGPDGIALVFLEVRGLYSDPCHGNLGDPDIEVGPTVDDLVNALASQPGYEATAPTDVVVDGYAGKRIDLQLPSDIDFTTCDEGQYWVWDAPPYAQGPGNRWHLLIVDIGGTRAVILNEHFAGTPVEQQTEVQAIIDSIQIAAP